MIKWDIFKTCRSWTHLFGKRPKSATNNQNQPPVCDNVTQTGSAPSSADVGHIFAPSLPLTWHLSSQLPAMRCCLKLPVIHYTNKLDSEKFFEIDTILHEYFRRQSNTLKRTNDGPLEINVISGSLLIVTISMSNLSWPYPRPLSRYFTSSGVEKSREDIRFRWSPMDILSLLSPHDSASLLQIATELKMAQFPTYFCHQFRDKAEMNDSVWLDEVIDAPQLGPDPSLSLISTQKRAVQTKCAV